MGSNFAEVEFFMSDVSSRRPLSPHLTIHRPFPTMVMSIVHRITGMALYFGTLLVAWWLMAIAGGPESYDTARSFFGSIFGLIILFGYSWALLHHMLGGIRHFIWDTGTGLERETSTMMAWATIAGSAVLTVLVWIAVFVVA